jgi:hypothetical protein
VCDGFHAQYLAQWGDGEARPYAGPPITDPRHFIREQPKLIYVAAAHGSAAETADPRTLVAQRLPMGDDGRAGVKRTRATS